MKTNLKFLFIYVSMALIICGLSAPVAGHPLKALRTMPNNAFKQGEVLEYRVHYGFMDAGYAKLEVMPKTETFLSRPCYRVVGTGYSVGAFNWFFKVDDRYESYLDTQAIAPWYFIRRVNEGGYKISQNVVFNHFNNTVKSDKSTLTAPEYLQDLISAFYYARTMDMGKMNTGDIIPIQAWLDDEVIPLNAKIIGREKMKTKFGTFKCIILRPMLQQGRVFKDNEDLTIWITDDKNKIPVRAEARILVGSIKMDLKGFKNLANPMALETD